MINYKVDKIKSCQLLDKDTLEPIANLDGIGNVTTEIEPISLGDEVLSFNHSASFEGKLNCDSLLYSLTVDYNNKPLYIEYYVPIMIQARWHKKRRINKKWLKRYGMKKDEILVRCNINSVSSDSSDPYNPVINFEFDNMKYKFRPDQMRKNLKIEMCYELTT